MNKCNPVYGVCKMELKYDSLTQHKQYQVSIILNIKALGLHFQYIRLLVSLCFPLRNQLRPGLTFVSLRTPSCLFLLFFHATNLLYSSIQWHFLLQKDHDPCFFIPFRAIAGIRLILDVTAIIAFIGLEFLWLFYAAVVNKHS